MLCGTLPICIHYTLSKGFCQYPDLNLPLCNLTCPVKYAIIVMECRTLHAIGGSILPPETEVIFMSPMEVFTFVIMLTDIVSLVLALAMNNKKK